MYKSVFTHYRLHWEHWDTTIGSHQFRERQNQGDIKTILAKTDGEQSDQYPERVASRWQISLFLKLSSSIVLSSSIHSFNAAICCRYIFPNRRKNITFFGKHASYLIYHARNVSPQVCVPSHSNIMQYGKSGGFPQLVLFSLKQH
ncbi:hypothetical protein [Xenorhabdus sp. PB62.4]|uniref:hypothetical protein n=1 Tax=Xenorhabdus sp. PB62.4 TaxID=1851573 RepID=UPI00165756E3|nr:hypothetical protein [Xenorhabdus sp. PB62.4]